MTDIHTPASSCQSNSGPPFGLAASTGFGPAPVPAERRCDDDAAARAPGRVHGVKVDIRRTADGVIQPPDESDAAANPLNLTRGCWLNCSMVVTLSMPRSGDSRSKNSRSVVDESSYSATASPISLSLAAMTC